MSSSRAGNPHVPRIRQSEQLQRRGCSSPSASFTVKRTVPQWHAPSIVSCVAIARLVPFKRNERLHVFAQRADFVGATELRQVDDERAADDGGARALQQLDGG